MSIEHLQVNLFDNKNISDLIKEIYSNQNDKKDQLQNILDQLTPLISLQNTMVIGPTVDSLIDSSIKNDELLIKLLTSVQKIIVTNDQANSTSGVGSTSSEIDELIKNAVNTLSELKKDDFDITELNHSAEEALKTMTHEYIEAEDDV